MISTKKGDKGQTSLFNGRKVSKNSAVIWALGEIDELNSYLGVVKSETKNSELNRQLEGIQADLFLTGSILAGYPAHFNRKRIKELEERINKMEMRLPLPKGFIFPDGSLLASRLFFARSLARRVERRLVDLDSKSKLPQSALVLAYFNRLSDYLFVLGRSETVKGEGEKYWRSGG